MPSVEARLERAYNVAADLLDLDLDDCMIDVFLSELVVEHRGKRLTGGYAVPERLQLHDVYAADSPAESLERSLVALLLSRAAGLRGEPPPFLVDGLHARVMQHLGSFPDNEAVASALAEARGRGELPSIEDLIDGPNQNVDGIYYQAALNFVEFILRRYGLDSFKRLAVEMDAADPVRDLAPLTRLDRAWRKSIKPPRSSNIIRFVKLSLSHLRGYKRQVAEIVLYVVLGVAFGIAMAKMQGLLFDQALAHHDLHALAVIMGTLVVSFIVVSITQRRQRYLVAYVSGSVLKEMRLNLFSLLQRLEPGFFQTTRTGDIISRMTSDMGAVQGALTNSMLQGFRMTLTLVAAIVTIVLTDWRLGLVGLAGTPLFVLTSRYFGPRSGRASKETQRQLANATSVVQENLGAQPVVKAFGLEDRMVEEYTDALDAVFRAMLRTTFLGGMYGLTIQTLTTAINLTVLGVGAWLAIKGHLTAGVLVSFLSLMGQVIGPVQNISNILQGMQQATGAMDRIDEMLMTEPSIKDAPHAEDIQPLSDAIRLEHVTFGYREGEVQLHDVNLTIPARRSVALVGPSGCGKSTILNMIMRFYEPRSGGVTFDGVDIRRATIASLRGQMGVVFQDNVLFNMSIRENVRLGKLDATDEEVEEACRAAEIHELIMSLPEDYDTIVGERGSRLSGGQRQRLAIARALLRNPTVLLLDEATSALDPRTEASINGTLRRIGEGRTTVSVTHRLSSIVNVDRIYALERGRVVEHGTHDELLAQGGMYAALWAEQGGAVTGGVHDVEVAYLRKIPMFSDLDQRFVDALANRLLIERFDSGDGILRQGDAGDKLYIVRRGQVEVVRTNTMGQPRVLAVLRERDYFGEMALLHDVTRTATVRARTPVELYTLDRGEFEGLLASSPELRAKLEQDIARRTAANAATIAQTSGQAPEAALERPGWPPVLLSETELRLGSARENDVLLPDPYVSPYHAIVRRVDGQYTLFDLEGAHSTLVNGEQIHGSRVLEPGDELHIGSVAFIFRRLMARTKSARSGMRGARIPAGANSYISAKS